LLCIIVKVCYIIYEANKKVLIDKVDINVKLLTISTSAIHVKNNQSLCCSCVTLKHWSQPLSKLRLQSYY